VVNQILGYKRHAGPPGIRNHVVCLHTVECSSFVSQRIATIDPQVQSLGFPGCYRNRYASRLMIALATHPNVGACLLVSLGCEGTDAGEIAQAIRATGRPVEVLRIQEAGGTEPSIAKGREIVGRMLGQIERAPCVSLSVPDLIIGTNCGASDATSGITANPAVGCAFDMLVDSGATVLVTETVEMVGCGDILGRRAANPKVAIAVRNAVEKAEKFSVKVDQFSIAPGNQAGGLTTIEEKSMGALAKCGSRPIKGVVKVAQRPIGKGLYIVDSVPDPSPFLFGFSNANDSEDVMALISCGAHVVIFTTGLGSVTGSVISPVLKVCGNPRTYAQMSADLDINAGRILTREATVAEVGKEIFEALLYIAAGKPTAAEVLGHQEYFIPYKYQDFCANA